MSVSVLLNPFYVRSIVTSWLEAESPISYIGFISTDTASADVCMCNQGTLAGSPFVDAVIKECGCKIDWHVKEGASVDGKNTKVATISGPASEILSIEKVLISILSRASGITTFAKRFKKILADSSWEGNLRAVRTPVPGLALIEEYSMLLAGVLSIKSDVVIRHNHTRLAGGIEKVLQSIRPKLHPKVNFEVECLTLKEAQEAASSGASIIEFTQMPIREIAFNSAQLKSGYPDVQIQASGSFDESSIKTIATPNVNLISSSKLSCGYNCIDFVVTVVLNVNGFAPVGMPSNASCDESEKLASSESSKVKSTNQEISSSPPAAKKSRLEDNVTEVTVASSTAATATVASVSAANTGGGGGAKSGSGGTTPTARAAAAAAVTTTSTAGSTAPPPGASAHPTAPSKEQASLSQQKRPQRNQRNSYSIANKITHSQSGGGGGGGSSQLLQMGSPSAGNPRFSSYSSSMSRAGGGGNLSPYQASSMNTNFSAPSPFGGGGGASQLMSFGGVDAGGGGNSGHLTQQQSRFSSPAMRGGGGFLAMQQQSHRQHGWGGSGADVGGGSQMIMHGVRMQSGVINCGACGEVNSVGLSFCRRCRVHLR